MSILVWFAIFGGSPFGVAIALLFYAIILNAALYLILQSPTPKEKTNAAANRD